MPAVKGKHNKNKKKRVSVPIKKGRKPSYIIPDWLHWLITAAILVILSIAAYYVFLRPYVFRLKPCRGTKEYGVCLPSGFLCYGIDVSHHQGKIDWARVAESSAESGYPIRFVIMKATESDTFTDPDYQVNITNARNAGLVCGVYHFYDPGTSPRSQAQHFINTVKLQRGDFVPVIDVERTGRSSADLRHDLIIFIKELESHYGVKPMIYASAKFHRRHLNSAEFDSYPLWVAHYYVVRPVTDKQWRIWQFTDHASIDGIKEYTDFNVFRGTEADFNSIRIK